MGSFHLHGHGPRVHGNLRIWRCPPSWLRGRRQVVTALSVPCNPHVRVLCSSLKSIAPSGRPVLGDLPVHLTLRSISNHVICMIINYSLHGYIRTCLLHLGIFFYSLFSFYPWGWLRCVSLSLKYHFYPYHDYGPLCKYVILFMLILDSYTLPSFGKI